MFDALKPAGDPKRLWVAIVVCLALFLAGLAVMAIK